MIQAMVAYPAPRLEPTETGSRITVYWIVRGWFRQPDGWMSARARVHPVRALPVAWDIVRRTAGVDDVAALEEMLRGRPGIQVTRFTAGPDTKENS